MQNAPLIVAIIFLASFVTNGLVAQEFDSANLDLPAVAGFQEDEEEDIAESILFYGGTYEGDAFFWCLDRSGSMLSNGRMQVLKQEVTLALNALSGQADFGITSFSDNFTVYNPAPVRATRAAVSSAVAWVNALNPMGATCMAPAAVETLRICNESRKRTKVVILLSDGAPNCPGCDATIASVVQSNWQHVPVNTIFVGSGSSECMQNLANSNNGTYRQAGS